MKRYLSLLAISIFAIIAVGCGKDDSKDDNSSKDGNSSAAELVEDSRSEKEFEQLKDTLTFAQTISGIEYVTTIYFEDEKPVNGVMQMKCPDEQTALNYYSMFYNSPDYAEVVRDGVMVSYDYSQKYFDDNYKELNKEGIIQSFEGQGLKQVK